MRISDWSSDVCSSDLGQQRSHAWAVAGDRPEGDGFPGTLVAPVVVVAFEDDLLAALEFLELVHAGADGGLAGVEVLGLWIAVHAGPAVAAEADIAGEDRKSKRLNSSTQSAPRMPSFP